MKTWLKVLLTVVITAGIVGYGTYYFVNKKATTDKKNLQAQIDDLNKKITTAETALTAAQAATTTTTTTSTTITTDPTAGWKTYTNTAQKFLVKYPSSVTPSVETTQSVEFQVAFGSRRVSVVSINDSLDSWVNSAITDLPTGTTHTTSSLNVNNVSAKKLTITNAGSTSSGIYVFVIHNNKHYEIIGTSTDLDFDNFLSTFQFTD